jgi:hypothetical protein
MIGKGLGTITSNSWNGDYVRKKYRRHGLQWGTESYWRWSKTGLLWKIFAETLDMMRSNEPAEGNFNNISQGHYVPESLGKTVIDNYFELRMHLLDSSTQSKGCRGLQNLS